MQSQQKRVKWSRGETAEALEERTDTGITQASVELMENCIPDIYGNVSRRPAFKLLPTYLSSVTSSCFWYDEYAQIIPFYLTEDEYILICVHFSTTPEFMRIKNGAIISIGYFDQEYSMYPVTGVMIDGTRTFRPVSYAQQNNYILISDAYNLYKFSVNMLAGAAFEIKNEVLRFSAGWYAPNGTEKKVISAFDGQNITATARDISQYLAIDSSTGTSAMVSAIPLGLKLYDSQEYSNMSICAQNIPIGSIAQFPQNGAYMRVEGFFNHIDPFPGVQFDGVLNDTDAIPATGTYCRMPNTNGNILLKIVNGEAVESYDINFSGQKHIYAWVDVPSYSPHYASIEYTPGSGQHFGGWTKNSSVPQNPQEVWMYGELLTPVAKTDAIDSTITIETGYISLQPSSFNDASANYPHPKHLVFNNQRLWAGSWATSATEDYTIVIGSQISRYNDFKNDYNQQTEPITLDILTQFKETVTHLIDYNGLKIMTDVYEYAYDNGGIIKQSANGSFEYCEPIIFDSLCLYVDSSGCQVKAMQYEFQADIFNSSTINQLAPHDLVWYPWGMAAYEDKTHSTGKYLFLTNRKDANTRLAVCNFVPGNQANIWNRWSCVNIYMGSSLGFMPVIHSAINLKNDVIFVVAGNYIEAGTNLGIRLFLTRLDFSMESDFETGVISYNGSNYFGIYYNASPTISWLTIPGVTVNVYANGVFQWTDTTTSTGALTKDISTLTNVTVGIPINAKIRSHPIDVGGKTKSIKKRIGKAQMSVSNTPAGAISINGKTGYTNPRGDHICFYGVTGMKDEIRYTITNKNGAMFHLESLLMNIEYGTLSS